ncbi:LLM class F420-dependent oxidoreductase [Cumulibacter manganitolerans]|uniref:LLM class F420-dependent oxidoreductase n=1 Tax=Cumulibacter manganitolerans TaxID=1884992 RepID=UPI00129688DF|nr:LLM class F420-dependent oxidoreductase [Cumulibacter manganitolerans]
MKLGVNLGYWGSGNDRTNIDLAVEADRLGFDVVWAAEAYGNDVVSTLAYVAARTERIDIGSAVMQIPGRTPAMTAMTAAGLDSLSGGRFRLGLGVSGPQVSEGWHGVRYDKPLGRTREYIEIVRMALQRKRVRYDGKHFQLPLPDGPGKALMLVTPPLRADVPIYLAAVGPKNLELTGEIADGWLGVFTAYDDLQPVLDRLAAGAAKAGRSLSDLDVGISAGLAIGDDLDAMADRIRPHQALYVGGMGSREANFYNRAAVRLGYEAEAARIQDLYLRREYAQAQAAVPLALVDRTALIGPVPRVADRLRALRDNGATTVNVSPTGADSAEKVTQLRQLIEAAEKAGIG